jgi:hypothetical protein
MTRMPATTTATIINADQSLLNAIQIVDFRFTNSVSDSGSKINVSFRFVLPQLLIFAAVF